MLYKIQFCSALRDVRVRAVCVVNLRPAHPEHPGVYQMPIARLPHLEGVGGGKRNQLMKVYKALQLRLLTYEAPTWRPWSASFHIGHLERCQRKP